MKIFKRYNKIVIFLAISIVCFSQFVSAGQRTVLDGKRPPHGSFWGNEIAWTQSNAVQNTWYKISDSDLTTGQLREVTHDGSGKLTVNKSGIYHCLWSITSEISLINQHVQTTFSINGTETNDSINHYESFGASKQFPVSGHAILSLSPNDTVQVSIRTTDVGTPDISVDHLNVSIILLEAP